ncbi:MAG: hypothetical protein Q8N88_00480 [Nanoarchaeota archaeon]|nr:hypothetical protein [Nanoarchaeota archaeon]
MKRGEFNFVWLFAIVAGGAILILAIYGVSKFGETKDFQTNTELAKQISILTDPMQAGFAEGSFGKIIFNKETKIRNLCYPNEFGKNEILVSTKNNKWSSLTGAVSISNKYIFSTEENAGKEFYVFSKPFNFPYKTADMIFLTTEDYCFVNSPDEIFEEVDGLNMPNIKVTNCSKNDIKVCFGFGIDCDVTVYGTCVSNCDSIYDEGTVEKEGEIFRYAGNLLYGAIFSDKDVYDCNVERLMFRSGKITSVLEGKTDLMNARNCGTNMKPELIYWRQLISNSSIDEIISLNSLSKSLELKNSGELCGLW